MRTEPPSSLPTDAKHSPVETAAADPAEEPPVILVQIPGIVNGAETAGGPGAGESHFIQVQFAEQDDSGSLQSPGYFRIFGWDAVLKNLSSRGCSQAGGVDIVFERDRDAVDAA